MFGRAALLCAVILCSCSDPERTNEVAENAMSIQEEKIVLYQVITRLFGNTETTNKPYGTLEENGVGKFNDITDTALVELKKMGVSHVWYTGIIEHA